MKKSTLLLGCVMTGLTASLVALAGCQTQYAGMTLPSGRYLEHPPSYIPDEPDFPLTNELTAMQAAAAQGLPGGPPAPGALPRAVPPGAPQ
jgi:hypothetical protein